MKYIPVFLLLISCEATSAFIADNPEAMDTAAGVAEGVGGVISTFGAANPLLAIVGSSLVAGGAWLRRKNRAPDTPA